MQLINKPTQTLYSLHTDNTQTKLIFKEEIKNLLEDSSKKEFEKADLIAEMFLDIDEKIDYLKSQIKLLNTIKKQLETSKQTAKEAGVMMLFFTPKTKKKIYDANKLDAYWKRLLAKLNMPYRRKYNARHTFATLMIKNKVPIHIISQTMGHKNIQETLTIYAKFLPN